jgi:hypothetical protein
MNCKPGDLAIYVSSRAGNEGRIVRCLRLASAQEVLSQGFGGWHMWITDNQEIKTTNGLTTNLASDMYLRPIRDQDGEDEMLRIAGKPVKEIA